MLHRNIFFFIFILFAFSIATSAQEVKYSFEEDITWEDIQHVKVSETYSIRRLSFADAHYDGKNVVPYFFAQYPIHSASVELKAYVIPVKTAPLSVDETNLIKLVEIDTAFSIVVSKGISRQQSYAFVKVTPVRINPVTNQYEKLISFKIDVLVEDVPELTNETRAVTSNSVLSSGSWIKVKVSEDGVYKISYSQLSEMGFDVSVNPKHIAVFGNGGGLLPEKNDSFRHDDLVENPIVVVGEDDGNFNENDYLLFYGQGPVLWKLNKVTNTFFHQNNIYSDYTYYYVTALNHPAKRIENTEEPSGNEDITVNSFVDYAVHEVDSKNLASSGRLWVGEVFDFNTDQSFGFNFPNLIASEKVHFFGNFVANSPSSSVFKVYTNNTFLMSVTVLGVPGNGYSYGKMNSGSKGFFASGDNINVGIKYQRTSNSSTGYLDFIELNVHRKLIMAGGQMVFRSVLSEGKVAKFQLKGSNNLTVWDVTDPVDAKKVTMNYSGGTYNYKTSVETIKEFVAFDGSDYKQVEFVEQVANQNLHSIRNIDYLIVTHPDFLEQAKELGRYHFEKDGLEYAVVTVGEVYNEFSSGGQDISAIRDFAKMLYDNSDSGKKLRYLLFFGDASFDYKDRISDNTNFVPCWESWESLNIINSVATDDFFGCLDDGEGVSNNDRVDVGIGRLPVMTVEEAQMALDKVLHYDTKEVATFGSWRNVITFLADDEDYNGHMHDAETLADFLEANYPVINLNKIYVDAYNQISTPSGQKAPEVNRAINASIDNGTLIFNYSGHGGELGLGHERFMELADINSWTNWDNLTVFITATCEFSRYDDPARVSAGEQVFLNNKGGGIALFTTSRATYASANLALNLAIYRDNLFTKKGGEYPTFGDVILNSKVAGGDNDRKFILIGDPALKLAYPDFEAKTLKINQHVVVEDEYDTIRALQHVTIEGEVVDEDNNLVNDFNGFVYPTVFDKKTLVMTQGADDGSYPEPFYLWKSIIFNGKASINNGRFTFDFMVPKDIGYNYGPGRISYYFNDADNDGVGYYKNIIIGGYNDEAVEDTEGPVISLYINDTLFSSGDITDENPILLAYVEDESGINTTGNGIGHDIVANIDGLTEDSYILNDFYNSDVNRFNKGVISYPFKNLSEGWHTLTLKVWDIHNNSSESSIDFKVVSSSEMVVDKLYNYPNPFYDETTFVFSHNQAEQPIESRIDIYTLTGRLVKTIKQHYSSEGYVSSQIKWNGYSDGGSKLSQGIYLYNLTVTNVSGKTDVKRSKLVITK